MRRSSAGRYLGVRPSLGSGRGIVSGRRPRRTSGDYCSPQPLDGEVYLHGDPGGPPRPPQGIELLESLELSLASALLQVRGAESTGANEYWGHGGGLQSGMTRGPLRVVVRRRLDRECG